MKVRCPDCGSIGTLSAEFAGKKLRCSHCKCKFRAGEDSVIEDGVKWYYALGDEKKGPFPEAVFDQLVTSGEIAPSSLVWTKGMTGWQTLTEVRGGHALDIAQEEEPKKMKVRCPDCGRRGLLSAELAGQMVRCPQCGGKSLAKEDLGDETAIKWYYAHGSEKKGPIGAVEFDQLVAAGEIASDTLVWCKGMTGWQPLVGVRGEQTVAITDDATHLEPAPLAHIAPPADLQQAKGDRSGGRSGLTYAGSGERLVAKIIDLVFMFALASLVEGLSRKLFPDSFAPGGSINSVYLFTMFICFLVGVGYITWFVGKFGATPGKMVLNLKVVTASGSKIGYGQAFGRYWAEFVVVFLTVFLGYLPIFLDSQRRGLHDRLCGSRVVAV